MVRPKRTARRDAGRARGAPIADAVLRSTLEELSTHGLAGLRVDRIAERAEVNKTTVYRRWSTKGELVVAALEHLLHDVSSHLPDTGSLEGDLREFLEHVCALLESPLGKAIVRAALDTETEASVAAFAAKSLQQQASRPVREFVERARARGELRASLAPELLLFTLVGATVHRTLFEHAPTNQRWRESLLELVLQGALPRSTPPERS